MPAKDELQQLFAQIIDTGKTIDETVTEGVNIPIGRRSTLNLAVLNWEDPRLQLTIPARNAFKPTVRFTIAADLTWHDVIMDFKKKLFTGMFKR